MACYIISVELKDSNEFQSLREELMSYGGYCPINNNCWAIITEKTAVQIREHLSKAIDPGSKLFVIRSGVEGAWRNSYGKDHDEWLKKNL